MNSETKQDIVLKEKIDLSSSPSLREINIWTKHSIDFATQRNYLDELFRIYPTIPEGIRDIDENKWNKVETSFKSKNKVELIDNLLDLDLFPLKDSYTAYLKKDRGAMDRNPKTIDRLSSSLFTMGLEDIYEKCSQPKETNRQIGPMFRNWLKKGELGAKLVSNVEEFLKTKENAILDLSDAGLSEFAEKYLDYEDHKEEDDNKKSKGLDLVAKFNGKYVIGEAKFLTDFGGHQNAQFEDALRLLRNEKAKAVKVAILDGVLYIESQNKMSTFVRNNNNKYNIMSALVLKEFLYQI